MGYTGGYTSYILGKNNLTPLSHFIPVSHFLRFFKIDENKSFSYSILALVEIFERNLISVRIGLALLTRFSVAFDHLLIHFKPRKISRRMIKHVRKFIFERKIFDKVQNSIKSIQKVANTQ